LKLVKNLLLSFDTKLSKHAEQAVKVGLNTQKYQYQHISYSTDNTKPVRIIIKIL